MKKLIILLCVVLIGCELSDDPMGPMLPESASALAFVDSINQHFYKLHSQNFENAKAQTERAIAISRTNTWPDKEALASKNLGVVLYMQGQYEPAQVAFLRAYKLYDSLSDKSGLARVCNEMGAFYRKHGYEEQAMNLWNQAEDLAKEADDLEALGTTYGMKGTFYWLKKQYDVSDAYYFQTYDIRMEQGDSVGLGYVLVDLADMEQRKGNLKGALGYMEQSNQIRKLIGDQQGVTDNHKMIGDLYMDVGDYATAIPFYQQCAKESLQLGYPDLARKSYDSLASAYSLIGDYQQAFGHHVLAEDLEDSLFNLEKSKTIDELRTKYETAQKEKELAQKDLTIQRRNLLTAGLGGGLVLLIILGAQYIQRQKLVHQNQLTLEKSRFKEAQIEAAISSQEKERTRFAQDLHDGFGQMISILNLNLKSLENENHDRHEVFQESAKVLEDMYRELKGICFNLMPQTLIKSGIMAAVREFAARVNTTGKISLETDFFGLDNRLSEVQEISLYRITQEWVNNILKYSDADQVSIQITTDQEEITLMIEDNGSGFDAEVLRSGSGNGWRNMTSRANLIKGELELDTTPGLRGNTLIVNAPVHFLSHHQNEVLV